jgi:hypothetical protein
MTSDRQMVAAVIGDVVGSRYAGSRSALHASLVEALTEINGTMAPVVPFRITIGDEYQGCFTDVGSALTATLRLRLELLPEIDLRHGVGWGAISVLAESPRVEDGPGWWAARAAIDEVKADQERPGLRHVRTAYAGSEKADGPDEAAVNAALILRDQVLGGLSPRSLEVLRGLLAGRTQKEIAEDEGVTPSAVSQRVRNDGLAAVLAADEMLGRVR